MKESERLLWETICDCAGTTKVALMKLLFIIIAPITWFLPIKQGVIIIGAISSLMMLMGFISGSWWPIVIESLSTVFFVIMLCRPN